MDELRREDLSAYVLRQIFTIFSTYPDGIMMPTDAQTLLAQKQKQRGNVTEKE